MYNGVVLQPVKTNVVDRMPIYSEDGTEYKWTDFYIDINCLYNPLATSYNTLSPFPFPGMLAPQTDVAIREYLLQPRRTLYYSEGGLNILFIDQNNLSGDAIDANNGPTPVRCSITRIDGAKTFHINYVIKCSVYECPTGTVQSVIASNRYSRSETINDQHMSVVSTTGRAYFRSNVMAALAKNADAFRSYLIPNPQLGFRRASVNVTIESAGNIMDWSVTDVQVFKDLGNGAIAGTASWAGITKLEGFFGVKTSAEGPNGTAVFGYTTSAMIRAWGNKESNNWNMIVFAFKLASDKLPVGAPPSVLASFSLSESIMDKYIELSLTYFSPGGQKPEKAVENFASIPIKEYFQLDYAHLPDQGGVNPTPPYGNATRGTALQEIAVSAFRRACEIWTNPMVGDTTGNTPEDSSIPPSFIGTYPGIFIGIKDDLGSGANFYKQDPNGLYTNYTIKSEYEKNEGVVYAPVAGIVGGSSGSLAGAITAEVFKVHPPVSKRRVSFNVDRLNSPPRIPAPIPQSSIVDEGGGGGSGGGSLGNGPPQIPGDGKALGQGKYALVASIVSPVNIELMGDGSTAIYRISGQYDYVARSPIGAGDEVPYDIPEWVDAPFASQYVASSDYQDGNIWQT